MAEHGSDGQGEEGIVDIVWNVLLVELNWSLTATEPPQYSGRASCRTSCRHLLKGSGQHQTRISRRSGRLLGTGSHLFHHLRRPSPNHVASSEGRQ